MMTRSRGPNQRPIERAFTLIEMIVVITIISILLAVIVPGFNAMLYSSETALAENLLRGSLRGGKDAALKSGADRDSAVVFFFDPTTQRTSVLTYLKAGTLRDADPTDPTGFAARDVFVPAGDIPPITLPKGWMVRAFVPPLFVSDTAANSDLWYASGIYNRNERNWLFPETGFYVPTTAPDGLGNGGGLDRNTFMVRFEAGTGVMKTGAWEPALIVAPSSEGAWRDTVLNNVPAAQSEAYSLDELGSTEEYVRRLLPASPGTISSLNKRKLLGRGSPDTILARPVSQLALYDESRLAAAIGARPDNFSGSLYQYPQYLGGTDTTPPNLVTDATQARINLWIEGDTNGDDVVSEADVPDADRPEAKIFTIDRYTGILHQVEVQP